MSAAHSLAREGVAVEDIRGDALQKRLLQMGFAGASGTVSFHGKEGSYFYKVVQLGPDGSWSPAGEWRAAFGAILRRGLSVPSACPPEGCGEISKVEASAPPVVCTPVASADLDGRPAHPVAQLSPPSTQRVFCPQGTVGTALLACSMPRDGDKDGVLSVVEHDCRAFDEQVCSTLQAACPHPSGATCETCDQVRALTGFRGLAT